MARTIGYHLVKSAYGLWLPGEERGSWSDAWDEQIGFHEPHLLHEGDPVRKRMAEERMKFPAVRFSREMVGIIQSTILECAEKSRGGLIVSAMAVEYTHLHLALAYTGRDIDLTAKWLGDQTTKAVHRSCVYAGPVWCKGSWRTFVFEDQVWGNVLTYIRRYRGAVSLV